MVLVVVMVRRRMKRGRIVVVGLCIFVGGMDGVSVRVRVGLKDGG